ncbi:MAG: dihydropteroate synthase [Hyphomicrobiales bacterium]|nr:MAG: dihydropteroate synthase [Hyphomicrobiales bacterium]
MSSHYIRPIGPLPPGMGKAAAGEAIFVGRGETGFCAAELIERRDGVISREVVTAQELAARTEPEIAELRALLATARGDIAGLTLDRTRIMGIVNVTPDSFSDGGQFFDTEKAIAHGLQLAAEGAEILDIGGESTRPGAAPTTPEEECDRVLPVIEGLKRRTTARLSIDTRNSLVMRRAIEAGVHLVNDVSALAHDPLSLEVVARSGLPVVLMHMLGDDPRTMQAAPTYDDVVLDVTDYLAGRIAVCEAAGIPRERIIVDPGIGFGKTINHNLELLRSLSILHGLGTAVLLGASRKSFIANLMKRLTGADPQTRLAGSLAAVLNGVAQGVQIVRVHDVAETRQAIAVATGR